MIDMTSIIYIAIIAILLVIIYIMDARYSKLRMDVKNEVIRQKRILSEMETNIKSIRG